ncbi:DoxX family membrane protein [Chitinophaga oryziterrae]|uniref:DoxX family membrane protein n=1 Tax=Chitinophaga oryziterrae TaxID=1031224 RepID=A0A6N8JD06_9BACT|nr:DoxX family protein [Chitinophaga oryziterrae]MVT42381.1 DoxX family membrane protein [Chitinophaga oryziterrae]
MIKDLLYSDAGSNMNNIALLVYRILLGFELFRVHGLKKFRLENGQKEHVPNPLHLPDKLNGLVATFSDTVVPFLLMLGVCTRLILLPVIGVTAIGYFVVHRRDSAEVRDVPYMYTISFLFLLITGAGTYSIDHLLFSL